MKNRIPVVSMLLLAIALLYGSYRIGRLHGIGEGYELARTLSEIPDGDSARPTRYLVPPYEAINHRKIQ